MICPNKNSQEWKDLVASHGERVAYMVWRKASAPKIQAASEEIVREVVSRFEDYKKAFSTLYKKYNNPTAEVFAEIIANEGSIIQQPSLTIPASLKTTLDVLSFNMGIPFEVINDKELQFKGVFVNMPGGRKVVVNTAYASKDTPFHEYFHPFVRAIKNSELYNIIANEAREAGFKDPNTEEAVTEYLGKVASRRVNTKGLEAFFNYLANLFYEVFGIRTSFNPSTTVGNVVDKVWTSPTFLEQGPPAMELLFQKINEKEGARKTRFEDTTDTVKLLKDRADEFDLTTDDTSDYYTDKFGTKYKRGTVFVSGDQDGEFSIKKDGKTFVPRSEYAALQDFSRAGLDPKKDTISVGGKGATFEQLVEEYKKLYAKQSKYGKAIHAYLQHVATSDPIEKAKAKEEFRKYATQYSGDTINEVTDSSDFYFLAEEATIILKDYAGISTSSITGSTAKNQDELATELTLHSDILIDSKGDKIATTADLVVRHDGGEISLIDYKTGDIFKDYATTNKFLEYGDSFEVRDSRADRAALELVLRAIMIKEQNPDARFRSVKIVKVSKYGNHYTHEITLSKYLSTIGAYYKANHPEVYAKLEEKGLLDADTYRGRSSSIANDMSMLSTMDLRQQKQWLEERMSAIRNSPSYQGGRAPKELEEQLAKYAQMYLELTKIPAANIDDDVKDLSYFSRNFKNLFETESPVVQTFAASLNEAKLQENKEKEAIINEFSRLMKNYHATQVDEKTNSKVRRLANTVAGAGIVLSFTGLTAMPPLLLLGGSYAVSVLIRRYAGKSSKSYYAFMWRKYNAVGKSGYFLNTSDTYQNEQGIEVPLTKEQKEIRDFFKEKIHDVYSQSMSKTAYTTKYGRGISVAQALGMPDQLPDDFMPRVPQDADEIRENEKFTEGYLGIKSRTQYWVKRNLTDFIERNYYSSKAIGVRTKYHAHYGDDIVDMENHSFDIEKIFRLYVGNMVHKKHFDKIYNLAEGVSNLMATKLTPDGKKRYENYLAFLQDHIYNNVLREDKPIQFSAFRPIAIKGRLAKILGVEKEGFYSINQDAIARSLKAGVSMGALGFKFMGATFNAVNLAMANTLYPLTAIAARAIGVPPEDVRFGDLKGDRTDVTRAAIQTGKGGFKAARDLISYYRDSFKEDLTSNKLYLIAKQFDWIPDNYDYEKSTDDLTRNMLRPTVSNLAFSLHSFVETNGALLQLSAILNSIYITNTEGKKMTLWDAYEVKDNKLVWKGGVRGKKIGEGDILSDMTELDSKEIKALRKIYERAQGGYRNDEKSAIEATVLGEFVTQFKRFFFTYVKSNFQTTFQDDAFGKYVEVNGIERPDGVPVYEWEAQVMHGRVRLLGDLMFFWMLYPKNHTVRNSVWNAMNVTKPYSKLTKDEKYRRQRIAELAAIFTLMMLAYAVYSLAYDDDDEDTYQAKRMYKLVEDASFGINPQDIISTAEKPIVFLDKMLKFGKGFTNIMSDVITGDRSKDGRVRGIADFNQIFPGASNARQLEQFLTNKKFGSDKLFGFIPINEASSIGNR